MQSSLWLARLQGARVLAQQHWKHTAAVNTSVEVFWKNLYRATKPIVGDPACSVVPDNSTQVHVFWDWDNKYAVHTPPADLVANLRTALQPFGEVAGICAYGNTHTFAWVPPVERARRELFFQSQSSGASPGGELDLRCSVCGAYAATPARLAAHFRQLHVRQMEKRAAHQPSFRRWRQGNAGRLDRYAVMKHAVQPPKRGYGLNHILRHLGVAVRQVSAEPQAADLALKADVGRLLQCMCQAERRPACGVAAQHVRPAEELEGGGWPLEDFLIRDDEGVQRHAVCIVSNDLGFDGLLRRCRAAGCRTVAVSNQVYTQYRHADVILSWELVQRGLC